MTALWRRAAGVWVSGATVSVDVVRRHGWRRSAVAALALLFAAVFLIGGVLRVRVDTRVESFLPASDPAVAAVEDRARDFGGDPVIVLLRYREAKAFVREPAQLNALSQLEASLARLPNVATVYGPATVLRQLSGAAQNFLADIGMMRDAAREFGETTARAAGKSPQEVAAAGQAAVDVINYRYAPLVVKGLPIGLPTLQNARFTEAVLFGPDGLAKPEWRFIVPGTDTAVILVRPRQEMDQASTHRLVTAIRTAVGSAGLDVSSATVSGVPTVTSELSDEVTQEIPLIGGLVALAVLLRYLLVSASGTWLQRLRPLIASLLGSAATVAIVGWCRYPLSFGAVMLLPLLIGVGSSFPLYLATMANRRRVLVMSAASAAAFLTLAISPLPFVRDLGFTLGAGVLLTIGVTLVMNRLWRPTQTAVLDVEPTVAAHKSLWSRAGVVVIGTAVALCGWLALPRIAISADPVALANGLPAVSDAKTVEATLGASGEFAVRLTGPDTINSATLAWTRDVQNALTTRFAAQLSPVLGPPALFGFLGSNPTDEQIESGLQRIPPYLTSSVVRPDRHVTLLVYGVKLQDLGAQQHLLSDVQKAIPPPPAGYSAELVGLPVAAARGYTLLLGDRYLTNLAGVIAAGVVLLLGLRRRADAGRAVGAAVLATGWGLGLLWFFRIPFSPLTIALGSLVTVTGSEFVVLLTEARRRANRWLSNSVAIACLTSTMGYMALAASQLWLVREFGLVLGAAVVLSYVAAVEIVWLFPPTSKQLTAQTPVAPAMEV